MKIPGYGLIKGITNSMKMSTEASKDFLPVLVRLADFEQLGFEIERAGEKKAIVYLPGSPNPWSGTVVMTDVSNINQLDISVTDAMAHMEQLGIGSAALFEQSSDQA